VHNVALPELLKEERMEFHNPNFTVQKLLKKKNLPKFASCKPYSTGLSDLGGVKI
jgi:hypothetical protein